MDRERGGSRGLGLRPQRVALGPVLGAAVDGAFQERSANRQTLTLPEALARRPSCAAPAARCRKLKRREQPAAFARRGLAPFAAARAPHAQRALTIGPMVTR